VILASTSHVESQAQVLAMLQQRTKQHDCAGQKPPLKHVVVLHCGTSEQGTDKVTAGKDAT
jgi:hypothetical protein